MSTTAKKKISTISKVTGTALAVGAIGFSLSGPAIAATGETFGPDYSNLVGEFGKSRQAGLSKGAPIVRESIEMNGNKVSPSERTAGIICDGSAGPGQVTGSKMIVC